MKKHHKVLSIKLRLSPKQEQQLIYQASLVRHIFNWALGRRLEAFKDTGKGLTYNQQSAEMTAYKQANSWLYDAVASSLQQSLLDLDEAFKNFYEKRAGFPRFKSMHKVLPKLRYSEGCSLKGNKLKFPKLGLVRCHNSHEHSDIKSVSVKQSPTGEWFATCVTEFVGQPQIKHIERVAGIDLGLKSFVTLFDGSSFQDLKPPKFFREYEAKLTKVQKKLSRCKQGSANRLKAKVKVAQLHKRVANLRKNWLHQLTNEIVKKFDAVCLEGLNIKGMMKSTLGKSLADAALSEFVRQLKYKLKWLGKYCQQIDRWFPSSKLCPECGEVNKDLTLSDRVWTCVCGAVHDRDENASRNIRTEGISVLSTRSDSPCLKLLRRGETSLLAPSVETRISVHSR